MSATLSLGRLFSIRVGIHVSWIALFAVVTWSIASTMTSLPHFAAVLVAALCALLLFASVIVHELAHALVARRFGVETRAITLFIFGGVATLEREPPTPRAEIAIAVAGPLASIAVAIVAFAGTLVADRLPQGAAAQTVALVLAYLAVANGVLAAFNALPAFPMDGGRVLRAVFWMRSHDRERATRAAALVGVTLAACAVVATIVMLGSTHEWQYGWYAALGSFVTWSGWSHLREARGAEHQTRLAQGNAQ